MIDGQLTEPFWSQATVADGFRSAYRSKSIEGDPEFDSPTARVAFDDENLYVGIRCPLANQEAGLRMEMVIQAGKVLQFLEENGRLPDDLQEVGDSPDAVRYIALAGNVFQLTGETGEITITFTSTEPLEELLADALTIVSGNGSATTG